MNAFKKKAKEAKHAGEAYVEKRGRAKLLEELFYDFHSSKSYVYRMNFFRGIFFGIGSAIGATVVVALLIFVSGALVNLPGGLGDLFQTITNALEEQSNLQSLQ